MAPATGKSAQVSNKIMSKIERQKQRYRNPSQADSHFGDDEEEDGQSGALQQVPDSPWEEVTPPVKNPAKQQTTNTSSEGAATGVGKNGKSKNSEVRPQQPGVESNKKSKSKRAEQQHEQKAGVKTASSKEEENPLSAVTVDLPDAPAKEAKSKKKDLAIKTPSHFTTTAHPASKKLVGKRKGHQSVDSEYAASDEAQSPRLKSGQTSASGSKRAPRNMFDVLAVDE